MTDIVVRQQKNKLRRETAAWQKATLGLLVLSVAWNAAQTARMERLDAARRDTEERLQAAEYTRDFALAKLGELSRQAEEDRQARAEQAAAFEAVGDYRYIGECTITAYCPCAECCGRWADGLTATGLPAVPGIVAVDESVIPLGSTVVIDGQKYLAADTGVTGLHVDICSADHAAVAAAGARTADVWVVVP